MIKGLGSQVIIKEIEKQNKTAAGIILEVDKKQYDTLDAEVIVPCKENSYELKKGDVVICDKTLIKPIKFEGITYLAVPEDCIIARIK